MKKLGIIVSLLLIGALVVPFAVAKYGKSTELAPNCELLLEVMREDFLNHNSGRGTIADVNNDGIINIQDLGLLQINRLDNQWCRERFYD